MLKELRSILRAADPADAVAADLARMFELVGELLREAGDVLWGSPCSDTQRRAFYEKDRQVNSLQQQVRKRLVGQLSFSTPAQQTRFLVLMSLVKDVERLGDYAKNLLEAADIVDRPLPRSDAVTDLSEIRSAVESALAETYTVVAAADEDRARWLCDRGLATSKRCDQLILDLAKSDCAASTAVPLALAARYYKRVQKHLMNLLSSVTMPLHRIDYFGDD